MATSNPKIKVLRIPADGTPMEIVECKTVNLKEPPDCWGCFNGRHLPDVRDYWGPPPNHWVHRRVVNLHYMKKPRAPSSAFDGCYYLIKTCEENSDCTLNRNENWKDYNKEPGKVFGDAFICRLASLREKDGREIYADMPKEAIGSADLKGMMMGGAERDGNQIPLDNICDRYEIK